MSMKAIKRLSELRGMECYFFTQDYVGKGLDGPYIPAKISEDKRTPFMWYAFDVRDPNKVFKKKKNWQDQTDAERVAQNKLWEDHAVSNRDLERHDPLLVKVVEELGDAADGSCAELKVVEIPDGVDYEIDEYDGLESIHEKHRTWR